MPPTGNNSLDNYSFVVVALIVFMMVTLKCFLQVSTNAGLISHFVNLQIVVPEATIQGTRSGEHHVDIGSVIDLVCVIEKVS